MNEIKVQTLTKEPAKIEFNHKEILKDLDENLKKYDGLTFTEDETADLRKTLAELRKGVKVVDRYRIDTKKELNEPVNEFEKQCKEIVAKFDDRIIGLDKQLKDFEAHRKAKKRAKVEEIIANVLNDKKLNEKYADRLIVLDEYLAKSISDNQLKETIQFRADQLLTEQEKEQADKEMIETYVRLKNNECELNLSVESYLSRLEFESAQDVKTAIENDVKRELDRKSREESEKQAKEELELPKVSDETLNKFVDLVDDSQEVPFEPTQQELDSHIAFDTTTHEKDYVITASENDHDKLVQFLEDNHFDFKITMIGELPF